MSVWHLFSCTLTFNKGPFKKHCFGQTLVTTSKTGSNVRAPSAFVRSMQIYMHNVGLERTGHTYLLNRVETLLIPPPTLQSSCIDLTETTGAPVPLGGLFSGFVHGDAGVAGGPSGRCVAVNLSNAFKPSLSCTLLFR